MIYTANIVTKYNMLLHLGQNLNTINHHDQNWSFMVNKKKPIKLNVKLLMTIDQDKT